MDKSDFNFIENSLLDIFEETVEARDIINKALGRINLLQIKLTKMQLPKED